MDCLETRQSNLFAVGEENFEEQVLKSPLPVIIDFWAQWCVHCRALAPVYQQLSEEYQGRLRFTVLNSDEELRISALLGVQALPTFIVFKGGEEVTRVVGPHPARLKQ